MNEKIIKKRWAMLFAGVFAMLFAGIIYAWSILKVPFSEGFGWAPSSLALNFTITMTFFCLFRISSPASVTNEHYSPT